MILKNFRLFFIFSAVLSLTFFACKPKKADYVEQGPLDRGSSTVFPEPSIDEEPKVFGYLNQVRFGYSNNPTKDSVFIKYISDIELGTFPEKTAAKYAAGFIDTTRIENPPAPTVKIVTPRFAIQKGIFEYYPNPTTGVVYLQSATSHLQVDLFNIMGSHIANYQNIQSFDMSNLTPGIYIARIRSEKSDQAVTYKIIKQ